MDEFNVSETSPGSVRVDAEADPATGWARDAVDGHLHPSCTAMMGRETEQSVIRLPLDDCEIHWYRWAYVSWTPRCWPYVNERETFYRAVVMAALPIRPADIIRGQTPLEA
jgi:hypothetical protein